MDKKALTKEIIELLRKVDRFRRGSTVDAWMNLPQITMPQLKSLFFISNKGGTNHVTLAAALGTTPANVTGIIDRLVEQKLVSRAENASDRRMLLLHTTAKGEEMISSLRERQRSLMDKALSGLTFAELETLESGLASLIKAFDAVQGVKNEHD